MSRQASHAQSAELPAEISAWIGRREERSDVISDRMAESFAASLSPHLAASPAAPLGLFWCLAPNLVPRDDLGHDGHPLPGKVLPALPFPRRMWAGGELRFEAAFALGDVVTKISTIEDIAIKTGSTGKLAFLTLRHHYRVAGRLILDERQDIVYRDAAPAGAAVQSAPKPAPPDPAATAWTVEIDPTLLFRYSALTFNGHRIHYDRPYAIETEGYAGLVVHGPLQATLMLNLAATVFGSTPSRFGYRGQTPLICDGAPARIEAIPRDGDSLTLRVLSARGVATMTAEAHAAT